MLSDYRNPALIALVRTRRWAASQLYNLSLVLLLILAAYSTMELAARNAQRDFIQGKLAEVRDQLSARATSEPSIGDSTPTSELVARQSSLRSISEQLAVLEFAGAQRSADTVHAIQSHYSNFAVSLERSKQIAELEAQERYLSTEIEQMTLDRGALTRLIDSFAKDKTDLPFMISLIGRDITRNWEVDKLGSIVVNVDGSVTSASAQDVDDTEEANHSRPIELTDINIAKSVLDGNIMSMSNNQRQVRAELTRLRSNLLEAPSAPLWTMYIPLYFISYFPTDIVLSIALICCGAVGALFAARAALNPRVFRGIRNGVMAGFIAFLLIKGGRYLFLVGGSDDILAINPYASAFAGIVAGLFTERLYEAFERILGRVTEGVEKSVTAAYTQTEPALKQGDTVPADAKKDERGTPTETTETVVQLTSRAPA
jgi:hypothetical protein